MNYGKLEKKDINPVVAKYSYSKIIKLFGDNGEHVASLMGVKKASEPKKSDKKDKEVKGGI